MPAKLRPTLSGVFSLSLLGLALSLALLFYLVLDGSKKTILQSAESSRNSISREVALRVTDYLNEAPMAVAHFEKQVGYGLVDPRDGGSVQAGLLSLLLANGHISEATFTFGRSTGFDGEGNILLDRTSEGQVTVFRTVEGNHIARKVTRFDGTRFVAATGRASRHELAVKDPEIPTVDPTTHLTFQVPASRDVGGRLLWTDLHWSQLDEALPKEQRRVEVSVQKVVKDVEGAFAGVLRIGLFKENIDLPVRHRVDGVKGNDPHLIFLCDREGRLITGFGAKGEHIAESNDDLRVVGGAVPAPVARALTLPVLRAALPGKSVSELFRLDGMDYLCTFRALPDKQTREWVVGIVVPRNYYLSALAPIRRRILWWAFALVGCVLTLGALIVHGVNRAHSMILRETSRMKGFEFTPSDATSRLGDIAEVLTGLEKAKTAMRAMGKYVPVDLVRRLYHDGREPELGGQSVELSVLFTDIKEFTPFAEKMTPDELAEILGRYLQVMATVIQKEKGTIDKFIGDAVMAFWNAPETADAHSVLACRAALRCREALNALYDSPEWKGAPRFETRLGLHRCVASVGHFGAPDRFNYTAIGDGINLASRLEGLNKQYGTAIIASETIQAAAKDQFAFRLLDRVAVKGKSQGLAIYELLSERAAAQPDAPGITRYEEAFGAFQRADFKAALGLLEALPDDPPSRILEERCRAFLKNPPGSDWNGIHSFDTK
jgi:adenylate cyclase